MYSTYTLGLQRGKTRLRKRKVIKTRRPITLSKETYYTVKRDLLYIVESRLGKREVVY